MTLQPRPLRTVLVAVALAAWLAAAAGPASARNETTEGYLEFRLSRLWDARETSATALRLRPSWRGDLGERLSYRVTAELLTRDDQSELVGADRSHSSFERAYLEWRLPRDTVVAGRQSVNWGSGLYFNPTEPFTELHLLDYWYERRYVTGLKVTHAMGEQAELTAVTASRDEWVDRTTAVRYAHRGKPDWALVYAKDEELERERYGLDLKGDWTVGWWFEGVRSSSPGEDHVEYALGADYTFDVREGLYVALQTYYDGSGADDRSSYDLAGLLAGRRRTLATRYTVATVRLLADARWTYSFDVIRNEVDGSRVLTPHAERKIGGNAELHLGVNFTDGEGELNPGPLVDAAGLVPGTVAFAWVRYHF